jgi:hypothetical protein
MSILDASPAAPAPVFMNARTLPYRRTPIQMADLHPVQIIDGPEHG